MYQHNPSVLKVTLQRGIQQRYIKPVEVWPLPCHGARLQVTFAATPKPDNKQRQRVQNTVSMLSQSTNPPSICGSDWLVIS